jgi:hypothetical protein
MLARDRHARGMDDISPDAVRLQPAGQPEAVPPGVAGNRDPGYRLTGLGCFVPPAAATGAAVTIANRADHAQTPPRPPTDDRCRAASAPARQTTPARPRRSAGCRVPCHASLGIAVTSLLGLQDEYRTWLDNLPEGLEGSSTAEKLRAIIELDLEELSAIDPPRGYGRD